MTETEAEMFARARTKLVDMIARQIAEAGGDPRAGWWAWTEPGGDIEYAPVCPAGVARSPDDTPRGPCARLMYPPRVDGDLSHS